MEAKKRFMLDIESTGVNFKRDSVLQIGLLEMIFDEIEGLWQTGRSFNQFLYYAGEPESEFAKKHMAGIYKECSKTAAEPTSMTRQRMLDFFAESGCTKRDQVVFCGWNVSSFDIQMLHAHGLLKPPGYETDPITGIDRPVGDHSYRYYEMGGAIQLAADLTGTDPATVRGNLDSIDVGPDLPDSHHHEALYDCYKQVKMLNQIILLVKRNLCE